MSTKTARYPMGQIILLRVALLAFVVVGIFSLWQLHDVAAIYDGISDQPTSRVTSVSKAVLGTNTINIPTYTLFHDGNLWTYVSKAKALHPSHTPEVTPLPVAHADAKMPMSVDKSISQPLSGLFTAAKNDGVELMVSSAYRSVEDQKQLYNSFLSAHGQAFTQSRVAPPGTSEHQTGLAIDISSASDTCALDSDTCELNFEGITWLRKNAERFGFIQRYAMGKQVITGYANEEWHYRYVGVPLAKALSQSGLTFDEFVEQVAPGYRK